MRDGLLPDDADDAPPVGLEEALPLLIGRSLERVVVVGAVALDDQPLPWPAQVGNDAPAVEEQRLIDRRVAEAAAENEIEHHVLEHALGRGRPRGEDACELLAAAGRA